MKVGENITLYAGANPQNTVATEGAGKGQRKTLFVGNLNQGNTLQDRIAQKKAEAQKQAMKIVGDAFAGDRAIDEDMESRRQHVKELKEEKMALQEEAAGVDARRADLEKAYAAGEISETEYRKETDSLNREEMTYNEKLQENSNSVAEENAVIKGTRQERLKKSPMLKAQSQADAIMEAAGKEIIGMAVDDAKEKVDEESERREEQAADIKEEREEQEEFIEKQKEKKEEQEEQEELLEELPAEEMVSLDRVQEDVKQEVQQMLNKMNLIAEDIKGSMVDQAL